MPQEPEIKSPVPEPAKGPVHSAPRPKKRKPAKKPKQSGAERAFNRALDAFFRTSFSKAVGQMFYLLGFYAECWLIRFYRLVRDAGIFLGQMLLTLFSSAGQALSKVFGGFFSELTAPFSRPKSAAGKKAASAAGPAETQTPKKGRAKASPGYGRLALRVVSLMLPLLTLVMFIFTVQSVLGQQFLLEVRLNDDVVGYVADDLALEEAKTMLRGRLRLANNQSMSDWVITPSYTLAPSESVTPKITLVNNILESYARNVDETFAPVEATGIMVNSELVAVTYEGERLAAYLDSVLQQHYDPEQPDAVIGFVKDVHCDPSEDALYLRASVWDYDDVIALLSSNVSEAEYYTVQEGDTLLDITNINTITMEQLHMRNPQFAGLEDDYAPEPGTQVLIKRAQPYLQVSKTFRRTEREPIPYETEYADDYSKVVGYQGVAVPGEEGVQSVEYDYTYVDGEQESKVFVSAIIEKEPVNEVIAVGKFEPVIDPVGHQGAHIWPVPAYTAVSRGWLPYHRAMDITAPSGTPIIATEFGVVITAEFHGSYGFYVEIDHGNGIVTLYAHMTGYAVAVGDVVQQGQTIGYVGRTGTATGNHLHYEVKVSGVQVDPELYITRPR